MVGASERSDMVDSIGEELFSVPPRRQMSFQDLRCPLLPYRYANIELGQKVLGNGSFAQFALFLELSLSGIPHVLVLLELQGAKVVWFDLHCFLVHIDV